MDYYSDEKYYLLVAGKETNNKLFVGIYDKENKKVVYTYEVDVPLEVDYNYYEEKNNGIINKINSEFLQVDKGFFIVINISYADKKSQGDICINKMLCFDGEITKIVDLEFPKSIYVFFHDYGWGKKIKNIYSKWYYNSVLIHDYEDDALCCYTNKGEKIFANKLCVPFDGARWGQENPHRDLIYYINYEEFIYLTINGITKYKFIDYDELYYKTRGIVWFKKFDLSTLIGREIEDDTKISQTVEDSSTDIWIIKYKYVWVDGMIKEFRVKININNGEYEVEKL